MVGGGDSFEVNTGVRQGSVLSPLLFIEYMDYVLRQVVQSEGETFCFAYADDVVQTARSKQQLEDIMNQWNEVFEEHGLKLSFNKTEYVMVARAPIEETLTVGGHDIAWREKFTYLGSQINTDNRIEHEIDSIISKFSKNVGFLYPLLREQHIPRRVKVHMYKTILKPILLYASETE